MQLLLWVRAFFSAGAGPFVSPVDDQAAVIRAEEGILQERPAKPFTAKRFAREAALFVLAGVCEIGGGWLIWQTLREKKPASWAIAGGVLLLAYGVVPTLQNLDEFGRIYAVYGGFFIGLALLWGWVMDGNRPDAGDIVGSSVALLGVLLMLYWPRATR
jgi:drug/metabolite transporter superfamily protein YnfA